MLIKWGIYDSLNYTYRSNPKILHIKMLDLNTLNTAPITLE
jgi:hypothetical protein